jgi:hypothetical protein
MNLDTLQSLIVIGNNKLTDIITANALGIGFTKVYSFGEDTGRTYDVSFFKKLHPIADIFSGDISLLPRYDLSNVIDCSTIETERGLCDEAIFVTSDQHEVFVGEKQDCGTENLHAGGIGCALAVDSIRKKLVGEYEPKLKQYLSVSPVESLRVLAIGCGGIGNYFALNSYNHDVRMVDFDIFESHNAHRQMFCRPGVAKAERLGNVFEHITPSISTFDEVYVDFLKKERYVPDVVVGCVDNGQTRNFIREYAASMSIPYFDGGVGTNQGQIIHNPGLFNETEIPKEDRGCARVHDPSIVIPNCIIGMQLANVLDKSDYAFKFDSLGQNKLYETSTRSKPIFDVTRYETLGGNNSGM